MQGKDFQEKLDFCKGLTTYIWNLDIGEGERVWDVVRGTSNWWLTWRERNWWERRHITDTDQTLFTLFLRVWLFIDFVWWLLLYWSLLALSLMLFSIIIFDAYQRQTDNTPLYVSQTPTLRKTQRDTHIYPSCDNETRPPLSERDTLMDGGDWHRPHEWSPLHSRWYTDLCLRITHRHTLIMMLLCFSVWIFFSRFWVFSYYY